MQTKRFFDRNLADAFLAGPWSLEDLVRRGARVFGRRGRWLRPLARRILGAFTVPPGGWVLTKFLDTDPGFERAWERGVNWPRRQVFWGPPAMTPTTGTPATWPLPTLTTPAALADWLGLELPQLDWLADCQGRLALAPVGPLHHYRYRLVTKRSGGRRVLEVPKAWLKAIQRRLLHEILDHLPPHEAAHGYRRGRSIASYAAPHCGQDIVFRFDLCDFFPSIRAARFQALFRTAGYPQAVARLLTGLCTNIVPAEFTKELPPADRTVYRSPHLPQGAPTSPALANLCAYRLDCRLAALANSLGGRFTRYADDLAFSGGAALERGARRFQVLVCRIALEEGFEVRTRMSRFMRQGVCQQLAGVVVNVRPGMRRREYDCLKATLHNCVRYGPASQDRIGHPDFRAHLLGRVAQVAMLHPERGRRLRELFERITWPSHA